MRFLEKFFKKSDGGHEHQPGEKATSDYRSSNDRVVRVFVSSTFRDMQEDRDVLVKHVFPELKKRCRERQVEFVEVDLRWGVTEEQAEKGEVLPICLAEIENCRPYFIGLLGERYGWLPENIDSELLESQPWLEKHKEKSLTELEILHGVLNNPEMSDRSFFYFRDPAYLDQVPPDKKSDFKAESDNAQTKLNILKTRIRESGLPVRENYPNPDALKKLVLDDLWKAIDEEYPEGEVPDSLTREAQEHEAFLESRAKIYIGREEYFERLDNHIESKDLPLVILGESGVGKSALLSNWVKKYRQEHPEDFLLVHFTGSTPKSADYKDILLRIMGEIKKRYNLENEIPTTPEKLREEFPNWLSMAEARGRFILILDGLNQLEDIDSAPDLIWLPEYIPENVRLIISTLPGRSLENLKERNWPTLTVEPLTFEERLLLIPEYLGVYRKSLSDPQVNRIAKAEQTQNPLYLKVLLDELRVFGIFEELSKRIEHYLEAQTVDDLYEKVLIRLEKDYEKDRPNLVSDAMSLIWASRRGLSESELLELLGSDNQLLSRAFWAPLYLALEESLVARSGLLSFFHDFLRQAVNDRYISTENKQKDVHLHLADYFFRRELDDRKIDELPWQFARANEWGRLYDLLADLKFFDAAWRQDHFEVKAYWTEIEEKSSFRMIDAYSRLLEAPSRYNNNHIWKISILLLDTGRSKEAFKLQQYLVEGYRQSKDQNNLEASLGIQAVILQKWGELDEAMKLLKEKERICRDLGNKDGLQGSLVNQAGILQTRGELDKAMKFYKEEERICRELGNKVGLAASLCNQAPILQTRGELEEAMKLLKEQERISRELGNKTSLVVSLGHQATILQTRGELDKAMKLLKEQERICRELGDKDNLSISLGNQALILQARGELEEAMKLLKEQERICRELGRKDVLSISLGNQGIILINWSELEEAMKLLKEQECICRELDNTDGLQASFGSQALILISWGELEEAMKLLKDQECICRELGRKDGLSISLGNQALLLANKGNPQAARPLAEEAYRLATEHGYTALAQQIKAILDNIRAQL